MTKELLHLPSASKINTSPTLNELGLEYVKISSRVLKYFKNFVIIFGLLQLVTDKVELKAKKSFLDFDKNWCIPDFGIVISNF